MDDETRRELEKLRADAIAMCDVSRELAERTVSLIDGELSKDRGSHRKPRRGHLTVVKGLITGAAAFAALHRIASVAAASAVTVAAVTVVAAPLVLRSPSPSSSPRRPAATQPVPHRGRRRPVVTVQRRSSPPASTAVLGGSSPSVSPSPSALISVSVSPSPSAPSCLIRLLGLCIP